jgi:hypothetical protein
VKLQLDLRYPTFAVVVVESPSSLFELSSYRSGARRSAISFGVDKNFSGHSCISLEVTKWNMTRILR